jgi:hypothetical protein
MNRRKLTGMFASLCVTLVFPSRRQTGPTQYMTLHKNSRPQYGIEYHRRNRVGATPTHNLNSTIYRPKTFGTVPSPFITPNNSKVFNYGD